MTNTHKFYVLALAVICSTPLHAGELDITDGGWSITFNTSAKTLTYAKDGKTLTKGAYVQVGNASGEMLCSRDYPNVSLSQETFTDNLGAGTKYIYTYYGLSGKANIENTFYILPDKDYLLVEAAIVATSGTTEANYIAPIVSTTSVTFLPSGGNNYIYDMPHDNDNWVGYSAQPWSIGQLNTSCEVSAFYDVTSREGLVVGSIEHDNWKSGISATPNGQNRLRNLTVAAGVVSSRTNDVSSSNPSLSKHGTISGNRVRSPRFFYGYYSDWRNGLEALGEATEKLCPKLSWNGGTIFAWQSWGGMADKVNYEGAVNVADFFHDQLQPNGFHNENGDCYIVLDSYWDNLTDDQLRSFVQHCKANGQHPGIYHTPFSYWGSASDAQTNRPYDGSQWTWAEISIKANGELRKIQSIALDPTHPGTIEYNRRRFEKFKNLGFEYVKLDFINNGTLEADSYYADGVTTGMQAYTYGMDKIIEMADGMFIDLSIAPIFPAKGHARRISCDCWGELNNSMYGLNSIELGWWLDRVYQYNDPDHLVLSRAESEGAARIRYTCGALTGTVLLGDNYSLKGSCLGNQSERDLAMKIATNADINAVAHIGRSFRPVEGMLGTQFTRYGYTYGVDGEFILDTDDALYYAVFNYDESNAFNKTADFYRLGIDAGDVKEVKELWTGASVKVTGNGFDVDVPKCDVRLYKLSKKSGTAIQSVTGGNAKNLNVKCSDGSLFFEASKTVLAVLVFNGTGFQCLSKPLNHKTHGTVSLSSLPEGFYVAKFKMADGESTFFKFFIR